MKDNVLERVMKQKSCKIVNLLQVRNEQTLLFSLFFEVKSFIPLKFDVIFRFNLSPCTNVFNPTLLLLWRWPLNACIHINSLVRN
jgi:hypothetical protein